MSENGSSSEKTNDQLILTDEARKQMIQDRADYAAAMMEERKRISSEQHDEAVKKYTEDQAKMIAVFRSMAEGKTVSETDEKKLMEYDPKLYMSAKMAQMIAQRADEEKESHFDEKDDEEYQNKMSQFNAKLDEMRDDWNAEFGDFVNAQKNAIVDVGADVTDIPAIKSVINLGGGIVGAIFDKAI